MSETNPRAEAQALDPPRWRVSWEDAHGNLRERLFPGTTRADASKHANRAGLRPEQISISPVLTKPPRAHRAPIEPAQ